MDVLQSARRVKHAGFLTKKKLRTRYVALRDLVFTVYDRSVPYTFDPERHRDTWGNMPRMYFLHREPPPGTAASRPVPYVIYVLWTGDNPLTPGRERGLASIRRRNPDLEVILVTPDNLGDFVVDGHPIHPAYEHLSLNHRSDYLRGYLMHHHGGAYSDIKVIDHGWRHVFDRLNAAPDLWVIGYPEVSSATAGGRDPVLGPDIRRRFSSLIGCGSYVVRPGTPFTAEWIRELDRRLDYYADEISISPGGDWGDDPGYPLAWIELGSDLFHPLQLKYLDRIEQDATLTPHFTDHR